MLLLITIGVIFGLAMTVNGDADVTLQLLTYINPTFGLAQDNYFCAYLSPNVPPPPNARGTLPNLRAQQNGFNNRQFPRQAPLQQYPQWQGGPPQAPQGPPQQQQQGRGSFVPYSSGSGTPNQQQYQQQQQFQQQQQQQYPQGYQPQQQQQGNQIQNQQQPQGYQQGYGQGQNSQGYQQGYQQQPQQQGQGYQQQGYQQQGYQQYQQQDQQPQYIPFQGQQACVGFNQRDFTVPNWNECKFSFATVFATFGGEPQVVTTGLIALPSANATINFTQTTWSDKCAWGDCSDKTWLTPRTQTFKIKPNIIEVIVTHYGDSVWSNQNTFTSLGTEQSHQVDTIPVNIASLVPVASSINPPPVYTMCVNGDQKGTNGQPMSTLVLAISVQCRQGFYGQYCNLTNCTTYDNNTQVCQSAIYPGQQLVCQYDNNNLQPVNCSMCPYGVNQNQCRTLDQLVKTDSADVTGYIVGIAILAILLAIALATLIILFVTYRKKDNNQPRRVNQPATTTASTGWFGTKSAPKNGAPAPTRGGYTQAPNDDQNDSEWGPRRNVTINESAQQQPPPTRPYNFPPPPARQPPSSGSTPENGSRREAAV